MVRDGKILEHWSVLVKLKIGVLSLQMETGRWKDTLFEYRLCRVCNEGLLENEPHLLLQCDALVEERSAMYSELLERERTLKLRVVP